MKALLSILLLAALAVGAWFFLSSSGAGADTDMAWENEAVDAPPSDDLSSEAGAASRGDRLEQGTEDEGGSASELRARRGGGFRVQLVAEGQAIVGARLRVRDAELQDARSDRSGRVEVRGLEQGRYRFALEHADVPVLWRSEAFDVRAGEVRDLGQIEVALASGIRGRIVDASGIAIAGATIAAKRFEAFGFVTEKGAPSATSGKQGRFELVRLRGGKRVVVCERAGYRRAFQAIDLVAGQYFNLGDIQLTRGRKLVGSVVDRSGRAVPNVEVAPQLELDIAGKRSKFFDRDAAAMTNAQGEFTLEGLQDTVRLRARVEGYTEKIVDVESDALRLHIVLEDAASIQGRVLGLGAGAEATVYVAKSGTRRARNTSVAEDGSFRIDDVEPGRYSLRADAPAAGTSRVVALEVPAAGLRGVELRLVPGCELVLRLNDAAGAPVGGAAVRLSVGEMGIGRRTQAGFDGIARFRNLWPGSTRLLVEAGSSGEHQETLRLPAKGVVRKTIVLTGSLDINGRVVDDLGRAAPGAIVRVLPLRLLGKPEESLRAVTSGDGHFRIGPLAEGENKIWAEWPRGEKDPSPGILRARGVPERAQTIVVANGALPSPTLTLPRPPKLRGFVRFQGRPMPGARVLARRQGARGIALLDLPSVRSGDDGRYELALSPGTWRILVKPAGGLVVGEGALLRLRAGEEKPHDIDLQGGAIEGRLAKQPGRSFDAFRIYVHGVEAEIGAQVSVRYEGGGGAALDTARENLRSPAAPDALRPDASGAFRFELVPAGTWLLSVYDGKTRLSQREVEVRNGELVRLGILSLAPTFPVDLKLVDHAGAAIQTAQLRIRTRAATGLPGEVVFNKLVRGGVAKIAALEVGEYLIEMRAVETGKQEPLQSGTLRVGKDGSVTGTKLQIVR